MSVADSSISSILLTVESSNVLVALTNITSPKLILPDNTLSPSLIKTGSLSPVSIELSIELVPLLIIPSTPIFSPFLTKRISPTLTSSTNIFLTSLPTLILTVLSVKSIKSFIEFLELLIAFSSSILPIVYNVITIIPSRTFFSASAPKQETVISKFSFIVLLLINNFKEFIIHLYNSIE